MSGPSSTLTITSRFAGPANSGNGGYTSGLLAGALEAQGTLAVTLQHPPPLDTALEVEPDGTGGSLRHGDVTVAVAQPDEFVSTPPAAASVQQALSAEEQYAGFVDHPFGSCFVCGTLRRPPDGLCLRPGRFGETGTACTWTPDVSLASPSAPTLAAAQFVWAALDCPGGWTSDLHRRPMVLGRMRARCDRLAAVGVTYVIIGALLGRERRKTFTATALYDAEGVLMARAEHTWISVDPTTL
jgi:hypothetical protein